MRLHRGKVGKHRVIELDDVVIFSVSSSKVSDCIIAEIGTGKDNEIVTASCRDFIIANGTSKNVSPSRTIDDIRAR